MKRTLLLVVAAASLAACGPTVGDPCTVPADCGGQICITRSYAPGGYCSRACTVTDATSCPAGTTCIRDGIARDTAGCFRTCRIQADCRSGYLCQLVHDNAQSVCVGPDGL